MSPGIDARREILLDANLGGEIPLTALDSYVRKQRLDASIDEVQQEVLSIIHELVTGGLASLGTMTGPHGTWEAWPGTLESSMARISSSYTGSRYQGGDWWFSVWLQGTAKGRELAEHLNKTPVAGRTASSAPEPTGRRR